MIKRKVGEYLERAEKLKNHLSKSTKPDAETSKPDDETSKPDAETAKLRDALSGAILTETPNVKWEDVAGLEQAKDTLKEAVILPIKVTGWLMIC